MTAEAGESTRPRTTIDLRTFAGGSLAVAGAAILAMEYVDFWYYGVGDLGRFQPIRMSVAGALFVASVLVLGPRDMYRSLVQESDLRRLVIGGSLFTVLGIVAVTPFLKVRACPQCSTEFRVWLLLLPIGLGAICFLGGLAYRLHSDNLYSHGQRRRGYQWHGFFGL